MYMNLSQGVKAQQHKFLSHAPIFFVYYIVPHDKVCWGANEKMKNRDEVSNKSSYVTRESRIFGFWKVQKWEKSQKEYIHSVKTEAEVGWKTCLQPTNMGIFNYFMMLYKKGEKKLNRKWWT